MSRHGPHFGETTQCIGLVVVMSGLADDSQGLLQQDMHPVIFAAAGVDVALAVEIVDVFARSRVWREALIFLDADLGQGQFMDLSIGFGGIRQRNAEVPVISDGACRFCPALALVGDVPCEAFHGSWIKRYHLRPEAELGIAPIDMGEREGALVTRFQRQPHGLIEMGQGELELLTEDECHRLAVKGKGVERRILGPRRNDGGFRGAVKAEIAQSHFSQKPGINGQ